MKLIRRLGRLVHVPPDMQPLTHCVRPLSWRAWVVLWFRSWRRRPRVQPGAFTSYQFPRIRQGFPRAPISEVLHPESESDEA